MPGDAQILARVDSINDKVACNDIDKAVKELLDFVKDYSYRSTYYKEALIISADYHKLKDDDRKGIMAPDELRRVRRQLLLQLVSIPDNVLEELPNAA